MAGNTGVSGSLFEAFVLTVRDQYRLDSNAPDITDAAWMIGRLQGQGQASAPSIKFNRSSGALQPTSNKGPHPLGDTYFSAVYEDVANVEARIHAQNWEQLDGIWTALVQATRFALGTASVPGNYEHISEGDDTPMPDAVKGSQILVQSFQWTILVPQAFGSLTEIDRITGSNQFIDINPAPGTAGPNTVQT